MKTTQLIILFVISTVLVGCKTQPSLEELSFKESEKLEAFFDKTFQLTLERSPQFQTRIGLKQNNDLWNDISEGFALESQNINKEQLQWLTDSINSQILDPKLKISYDLFLSNTKRKIDNFQFRHHNYPVNQMFGTHTMVPNTLINMHRIDSIPDAYAYISRVKGVTLLFDELIENLKIREEKGIVPPKFVFARVIDDCRNIISGAPFSTNGNNSIAEDFKNKVEKLEIGANAKDKLIDAHNTALLESAKPAYEKLISFLLDQQSRATNDHGVWKFPQGEAFYSNALANTTTTKLSPDEIHEIGLKEVARIHNEMNDIMNQVNFEGSLQDFFEFLRNDEQFYYANDELSKQLYMDSATVLIENMKSKLDQMFNTKPKADMIVKRVEQFREQSAGKAFYQSPAKDGSRPGIYYANLYNTKDMPKYEMEALAFHEGIPGHHMQLSISQEIENIPEFRKYLRFTAYTEGWGLYCEYIPKEMGFYSNPYSDYGRLAMELWRACRLVVDTGIHSKKWTREEGIAYYSNNTSGSERDCERMVERHIVMPSQATAYKIGMMKILELREGAKSQLGEKFDIREFHDVVLTNGAIPLDLLENLVQEWVTSKS